MTVGSSQKMCWRAVAVMDVEIDDRDTLGPVRRLGVARGDGHVVEEAETHRRRDFGMVAGRARGDEGVSRLAVHHVVDRECRAAGRAKSGLERAGRHEGVLVERRQTLLRRRRADRLDIVERMNPCDRRELRPRRGAARQHAESLVVQRPLDCAQSVGPLGMSLAHLMRQARRVADEQRRQWLASRLARRLPLGRRLRAGARECPSVAISHRRIGSGLQTSCLACASASG